MRLSHKILACTALGLAGCTVSQDPPEPLCPDYREDIAPLLESQCGQCHGAEDGFSVDDFQSVVGGGKDGRHKVVARDEGSPLLLAIAGENGHPIMDAPVQEALRTWVASCDASYAGNGLAHPVGFASPFSEHFHGDAVRALAWDSQSCQSCHGAANAVVGCDDCHDSAQGPTACYSCHGNADNAAPPKALLRHGPLESFDPHQMHVAGGPRLSQPVACETCHQVPGDWQASGHIFMADGQPDLDGKAEVSLAELAVLAPRDNPEMTASYEPLTQSCTVYCHSIDGAMPTWTQAQPDAGCELCHGTPPEDAIHESGLGLADCAQCHGQVISADGTWNDKTLHMDGAVSLGDGSESCSACHGSAPDGAPPPDLGGGNETSGPTGAHAAHLSAGFFRGAIPCSTCHQDYLGGSFLEGVRMEGHMQDSDLDIAFSGLATADGANPSYDKTTMTCSGSYCHAGGQVLAGDTSASRKPNPNWDPAITGGIFCGSCHGIPPTNPAEGPHFPTQTLEQCADCHGTVIDSTGALIFDAEGNTKHLNGVWDF